MILEVIGGIGYQSANDLQPVGAAIEGRQWFVVSNIFRQCGDLVVTDVRRIAGDEVEAVLVD